MALKCFITVEDVLMDFSPSIPQLPPMLKDKEQVQNRLDHDTEFLTKLPMLFDGHLLLGVAKHYFGEKNIRLLSGFWSKKIAHPSLQYWIREHIPAFEKRLVKVPEYGFKDTSKCVLMDTRYGRCYAFFRAGGYPIQLPYRAHTDTVHRLHELQMQCETALRCSVVRYSLKDKPPFRRGQVSSYSWPCCSQV
jgi:hypothetical protein